MAGTGGRFRRNEAARLREQALERSRRGRARLARRWPIRDEGFADSLLLAVQVVATAGLERAISVRQASQCIGDLSRDLEQCLAG
jgi:hypothetical protein